MFKFPTFEVGGCVRDELLGVETHDIDYSVEAPSFSAMREDLESLGFEIFTEDAKTLTIRARFPRAVVIPRVKPGMTADFVLCRRDSRSANHRHPDEVTVGTIFDDLARRDFTVNAMARAFGSAKLLDPHNGRFDLVARKLRFVGNPIDRLDEDVLRALRAVRFLVTKGFEFDPETFRALTDAKVIENLTDPKIVSTERVRDELHKAFRHNTVRTLRVLDELGYTDTLFARHGLWLEPTMRSTTKGPR